MPDVPALMTSRRNVAHLDILAPALLAQPGVAPCHAGAAPRLAGHGYQPLRNHLERFAFRHSRCIALRVADSRFLTVIIVVRRANEQRGKPAEQQVRHCAALIAVLDGGHERTCDTRHTGQRVRGGPMPLHLASGHRS